MHHHASDLFFVCLLSPTNCYRLKPCIGGNCIRYGIWCLVFQVPLDKAACTIFGKAWCARAAPVPACVLLLQLLLLRYRSCCFLTALEWVLLDSSRRWTIEMTTYFGPWVSYCYVCLCPCHIIHVAILTFLILEAFRNCHFFSILFLFNFSNKFKNSYNHQ